MTAIGGFRSDPISSPEPSLPLSSGTGKRGTLGKSVLNNRILVIRFPVPLDKGNEGSGDEIGSDLSITRKDDGNFGNVSAGVLFPKVA